MLILNFGIMRLLGDVIYGYLSKNNFMTFTVNGISKKGCCGRMPKIFADNSIVSPCFTHHSLSPKVAYRPGLPRHPSKSFCFQPIIVGTMSEMQIHNH